VLLVVAYVAVDSAAYPADDEPERAEESPDRVRYGPVSAQPGESRKLKLSTSVTKVFMRRS
jgi:hypothetical protein